MHVDIQQLLDHLNKLPNQIREASQEVIFANEVLEVQKLKYDVAFSEALLKASELSNATEKKAQATKEVQGERAKIIHFQGKLDRAENELEYLNNRFIALRKISSIEETLIKTQLTGV